MMQHLPSDLFHPQMLPSHEREEAAESGMIRVAVVEYDSLVREGVKSQLNRADDVCVVGESYTGQALFDLLTNTQPHVLILGAHVPLSQRCPAIPLYLVETLELLRREYPQVGVILLARHYFPLAEETLEKVRGYILCHDALALDLVSAIRTTHEGGTFFSETARHEICCPIERGHAHKLDGVQVAVLWLLASAPEVDWGLHAQALGMSYYAYQRHVQRAMQALGVTNRLAAVVRALQLGILRLEDL